MSNNPTHLVGLPLGNYEEPKIPWSSLMCPAFRPFLIAKDVVATSPQFFQVGCGPLTLSCLTGDNPYDIEVWTKQKETIPGKGTSQATMLSYLKEKGITALEIRESDLLSDVTAVSRLPITSYHVILACAKTTKTEASWFIFWGGYEFHNMLISTLPAYHLMSMVPLMMCRYVLFHPSWATSAVNDQGQLQKMYMQQALDAMDSRLTNAADALRAIEDGICMTNGEISDKEILAKLKQANERIVGLQQAFLAYAANAAKLLEQDLVAGER